MDDWVYVYNFEEVYWFCVFWFFFGFVCWFVLDMDVFVDFLKIFMFVVFESEDY